LQESHNIMHRAIVLNHSIL